MRLHTDEHTHTHTHTYMYELWCLMNSSKQHTANTSTKRVRIAYLAQRPGYRIDGWRILVRFPTKAKDFSLLQSVPGGFKYFIQRVQAVLSLAVQGPKREGDHLAPSNVKVKNEEALYLHFLICFTVYTWTTLLYLYLYMYVKRPALNGRLFSFATFASTENAAVRTGTADGVLRTRQLKRVFHKVWAISWLTMQLLASQERVITQTWTHDNTVARRLEWGNNVSRYTILRTMTQSVQHKCPASGLPQQDGFNCGDSAESKRLLLCTFLFHESGVP